MNHNQYADGEPQSVHDTGVFKAMIEEINTGEIWISPEGTRVEVIDAQKGGCLCGCGEWILIFKDDKKGE